MIRIRPAVPSEVPALNELVTASARELSRRYYTPGQIDQLIRHVFGVDTQLLTDGTYYVIERDGRIVACGGWSGRLTMFGGDQAKGRVDPPLDPARDPARIRAFFVHPSAARQGLGRRLLAHCERAAYDAGFKRAELVSTLPGVPFYEAHGYEPMEAITHAFPDGGAASFVRMGRALAGAAGATAIVTSRLELIPATPGMIDAALAGPGALASSLRAVVPETWPPDYLDEAAFRYTLDRLAEGPEQAGWWLHFVVLPSEASGRALIGSAGYKGPPTADGTVEVGYGIVSDHRRRGYASEATRGLLSRAFAEPGVRRAIAETLPDLAPSIGVLRRCGFTLLGEGSEPGVIRFELKRAEFEASGGSAR